MKLAFVLSAVIASVAVDAKKAYRNRHLTTYEEVCFPTLAPVPPPVDSPVPAPFPAPFPAPVPSPVFVPSPPPPSPVPGPPSGGKGGKGGTTTKSYPSSKTYPNTKSAPVPCPPSGSKSSGSKSSGSSGGSKSYSSPKSSPSSGSKSSGSKSSGGYSSGSKSSGSKSSGSKSSGGYSSGSKSSGSKSSGGYSSGSKSSGSKSGGSRSSGSKSGGSKSGGANGCLRFLQLAASTFGFGTTKETISQIQQSEPTAAQDSSVARSLQVISVSTNFAVFGDYDLPGNFASEAVLTWPGACFDATISIDNFIPDCQGCSFVVTEGSATCDPADNTVVTPFVDLTEVSTNPYTDSTFFDTDANGNADVDISNICTGTGPFDNVERPLLLLDSTGQIAACGILAYVCP